MIQFNVVCVVCFLVAVSNMKVCDANTTPVPSGKYFKFIKIYCLVFNVLVPLSVNFCGKVTIC